MRRYLIRALKSNHASLTIRLSALILAEATRVFIQ